jgi:hypothetical protein
MSAQNNLNELNSIMFDSLRKFRDGSIDFEKLKGVQMIAGTIIQNAKVQLDAVKSLSGKPVKGIDVDVLGVSMPIALNDSERKPDIHELKLAHAQRLGYKNVSEAIAAMTSWKFDKSFQQAQERSA